MSSVVISGNTSGSITLDSPAVAGNTTISLPATSGTMALTSQLGGMTLLGTLITTSGTTPTLSGLTLTDYISLYISINGVSFTANSITLTLGGVAIAASSGTLGAANSTKGFLILDLGTGVFSSVTRNASNGNYATIVDTTTYNNATTSIQFAGGTFDAGSILVYGVK